MVGRARHKDPYEVLGLKRGASLAEVRAAFRRQVVLCHPDSHPDDPAAAMRRFAEVTAAYETIMGRVPKPVSPGDYARMDVSWLLTPLEEVDIRTGVSPADREDLIRVERPTCDEPAIFALLWTLGLVAGLTLLLAWVNYREAVGVVAPSEIVLVGVLCEAVFLAVTLGAYAGLVHSRKIIWLIGLLGFWRRPRLPAPPTPILEAKDGTEA